jgi:hypothetical protein
MSRGTDSYDPSLVKQKGFVEVIGIIFIVALVAFILFLGAALGTDFYRTMRYGKGWVWQENKGNAVKEFISEKDGCVNYIDVWDREVKTCGIYSIEK